MTRTEYLFGHTKEKYHGVEFPQVGHDRVNDGRELIKKLYSEISYDPVLQDNKQYELRLRIAKVTAAVEVWKSILEEEY